MADSPPLSSMLVEAKRLYKENQRQPARQLLLDSLRQNPHWLETLLWLAKVSPDSQEAHAAINLALILAPQNESAQRGVADVRSRFTESLDIIQKIDLLQITGMTLAHARNVVYPFRNLRRPMGVLLDEGQIHVNDLAFAVEKAYDDNVRRAARTLLLAELLQDQVETPARPLNFVRGTEYTASQERRLVLYAGLLFGATFILIALGVILTLLNVVAALHILPFEASFVLGGLGLGSILLGAACTEWGSRYADESEQFKTGRKGEERVVDALRATLIEHSNKVRSIRPDRFPQTRLAGTANLGNLSGLGTSSI